MPFPTSKRFRIKDLARRWNMEEDDVIEQIRAGHFAHLIVYKDRQSGGITERYYISKNVPPRSIFNPIQPSERIPTLNNLKQGSMKDSYAYIHSIEDFPWPGRGETLYIPREDVEAFEKKYGIHPNQKATTGQAAGIDTPPLLAGGSDPTGQPWIHTAKTIGARFASRYRHQSKEQIAKKVHDEMVRRKTAGEAGMTGRGDRVPSVESIQRRGLTGIR